MKNEVWRWGIGLFYIFLVATIWIAASFVVQSVVDEGVSPFLVTYICNSLFVIYIPIVEIARFLEDKYGSLLFWKNKKLDALRELKESEQAILLGEKTNLVSNADCCSPSMHINMHMEDGQSILNRETTLSETGYFSNGKQVDEKGRWTRIRVAKVSLLICPFWFLAQLTFNLSLKYTTVTVSDDPLLCLIILAIGDFITLGFYGSLSFFFTVVKYNPEQCFQPLYIFGFSSIFG